jgi:hypothetical protein
MTVAGQSAGAVPPMARLAANGSAGFLQQGGYAGGGERVPDPGVYSEAKASANLRAARRAAAAGAGGTVAEARPARLGATFEGIRDVNVPPDETGAIGRDRYVEVVNSRFGVFDRAGNLLGDGSLVDLTGAVGGDFISDPQMMFDPVTDRFYYAVYENRNHAVANQPGIAWGFSTTASPGSAADWCRYFLQFDYPGSLTFPDFPQLGMSRRHLFIGANRFGIFDGGFRGADLLWVAKPSSGPSCPPQEQFETGIQEGLLDANGGMAFTPIPARDLESDAPGWVLSTIFPGGDHLNVYSMELDPVTGGIEGVAPPKALPVAPYSIPADAQQAGTTAAGEPAPLLDTLSGKLTQAYAAVDPRFGHVAIWTAHTVFGGAGSEVRWYEIDPAGIRLDQHGVVSDPQLYTFYGTIAPDRAIVGSKHRFGSAMVLGFDRSSSSRDVEIAMISKVGRKPQTSPLVITSSPGPNVDSSCVTSGRGACRWGDYSGASPDPVLSSGPVGEVWLTNEWNVASVTDDDLDWRTWVWAAAPGTPTR